jgi:hypothetical protein
MATPAKQGKSTVKQVRKELAKQAAMLWSPNGDCHIGLTSGHTFIVPAGKEGIEVPTRHFKEAVARGCIPVGQEPEDDGSNFDRAGTLRAVLEKLSNSDPADPDSSALFDGNGNPRLEAVSSRCGFTVSRREVTEAWKSVIDGDDGDEFVSTIGGGKDRDED